MPFVFTLFTERLLSLRAPVLVVALLPTASASGFTLKCLVSPVHCGFLGLGVASTVIVGYPGLMLAYQMQEYCVCHLLLALAHCLQHLFS